MLLGELGVGKTSIARRLKFGTFGGEYLSTVGFEVLTYEIALGPDGQPFQFLIWDTDGSFGSTIFETVYLKGAQAALFVADITRQSTIDALAPLAEQFDKRLPGRYSAIVLNKIDLLDDLSDDSLPKPLATRDRGVLRTSAKTGHGIVETFHNAAETVVRRGLV